MVTDFPNAGINRSAFPGAYRHPEDITTYGLVIDGVNYTAGCRLPELNGSIKVRLRSF